MKLIKDYEVEGCWTSTDKKRKTKCRACGAVMDNVPKEEHYNSQYWELQRHNQERLVCCPNGCSEKLGVQKFREFNKIRYYCTKNSESWNYKLDYNIVHNAWIDRKGKIFPCEYQKHIDLAYELNSDERTLERKGWVKLSNLTFMWDDNRLSQKQIDVIFDYINIYNKKMNKEFIEKIDNPVGILKLGE